MWDPKAPSRRACIASAYAAAASRLGVRGAGSIVTGVAAGEADAGKAEVAAPRGLVGVSHRKAEPPKTRSVRATTSTPTRRRAAGDAVRTSTRVVSKPLSGKCLSGGRPGSPVLLLDASTNGWRLLTMS